METKNEMNIPKSIAVIMDGNGRWAVKRGLPRTMGHKEGAKTLEKLIGDAGRLGVKYFTVYAFSTENWKRSEDEISSLMQLFRFYRANLMKLAVENGVKLRFIGDRTRFPEDIIKSINELEAATCNNSNMEFIIAANYGSRDEIRRAAMKYAEAVKNGELNNDELTEDKFSEYLDTAGVPDPDLLIRTSGELRLSNYLLWQIAYSEIVVTDVLWPDFNIEELKKCIAEFNGRKRRFGGV